MSKYSILSIQMRRRRKGYEELAAICRGTFIRHADYASRVVAERGTDLVFEEGLLIDGPAAFHVFEAAFREQVVGGFGSAGLEHEGWDQAVDFGRVVVALSTEGEEVLERVSCSFTIFCVLKSNDWTSMLSGA